MSEESSKKYWIVMFNSDNSYYVACSPEGVITVRDSKEKLLLEINAQYALARVRGAQGNGSANAHALSFQPRILEMSLEDMANNLFDLKKGTHVKGLGFTGNLYGLLCNAQNNVEEIFNNAIIPKYRLE